MEPPRRQPRRDPRLLALAEDSGYEIAGRIGSGGMGIVYRAQDADGHDVAIKLLRHEIADDPRARERLAREVAAQRLVRNDNIVRILDAELESSDAFVVTEFVPGPTLEDAVLAHQGLHPEAVREIGLTLGETLRAIHRAGVIHRDLKPSNVLLRGAVEEELHGFDPDGDRLDPVVIDFGIAIAAEESRLTSTGLVMGTAAYLDPEVVRTNHTAEAGDWWAWAAVLAFAATGREPYGGGRADLVFLRAERGEIDLVGVPTELDAWLRAALAADPAQRPDPAEHLARLGELDLERYDDAGETEALAAGGRTLALPLAGGSAGAMAGAATPVDAEATAEDADDLEADASGGDLDGGDLDGGDPGRPDADGGAPAGAGTATSVLPVGPVTEALPRSGDRTEALPRLDDTGSGGATEALSAAERDRTAAFPQDPRGASSGPGGPDRTEALSRSAESPQERTQVLPPVEGRPVDRTEALPVAGPATMPMPVIREEPPAPAPRTPYPVQRGSLPGPGAQTAPQPVGGAYPVGAPQGHAAPTPQGFGAPSPPGYGAPTQQTPGAALVPGGAPQGMPPGGGAWSTPVPPPPRRRLLVWTGHLVVIALAAVAPYVSLAALLLLGALARTWQRSHRAVAARRGRGSTGSGPLVSAGLAAPFRFLWGLVETALQALLPLVLGLLVGIAVDAVLNLGLGYVPPDGVAFAVAMAITLLITWVGLGSRTTREGAHRVVDAAAPDTVWTVVLGALLLLLLTAVVLAILARGGMVDYFPFPQMVRLEDVAFWRR